MRRRPRKYLAGDSVTFLARALSSCHGQGADQIDPRYAKQMPVACTAFGCTIRFERYCLLRLDQGACDCGEDAGSVVLLNRSRPVVYATNKDHSERIRTLQGADNPYVLLERSCDGASSPMGIVGDLARALCTTNPDLI